MTATSINLIAQCRDAQAAGLDFPSLWHEVLRPSALVIGPPIQTIRDGRVKLEIRLLSGGTLVFDSESGEIGFG